MAQPPPPPDTTPEPAATPIPPPPPPPPPGSPAPAGYAVPGSYGYAAPRSTNGFAVASMVLGILQFVACLMVIGTVLALVFGYKARRQIDESNGMQTGRGMATAGIVLGWVGVGLVAAYVLLVIAVAVADSGS